MSGRWPTLSRSAKLCNEFLALFIQQTTSTWVSQISVLNFRFISIAFTDEGASGSERISFPSMVTMPDWIGRSSFTNSWMLSSVWTQCFYRLISTHREDWVSGIISVGWPATLEALTQARPVILLREGHFRCGWSWRSGLLPCAWFELLWPRWRVWLSGCMPDFQF